MGWQAYYIRVYIYIYIYIWVMRVVKLNDWNIFLYIQYYWFRISSLDRASYVVHGAHEAHLANYTLHNRFLHNMICCHNTLFTKNELNRECIITLARSNPWWWSEKIETCRSGFKCFKWKLYRCTCWLIVEVITDFIFPISLPLYIFSLFHSIPY